MSLGSLIKQAAKDAVERDMPTRFFLGLVEQAEPLLIKVDERFYIKGEQIIVPKRFRTEQEFDDHWHTIEPVDTTVADKHKHQTQPHVTHIAYWRGLQVGDKVVLFRNTGGQEFLLTEVI